MVTPTMQLKDMAEELLADIARREFAGASVRSVVALLRSALQDVSEGRSDRIPETVIHRMLDVILAEENEVHAFERAIGRTLAADVSLFEQKSWVRLLMETRHRGKFFDPRLEKVQNEFRDSSKDLHNDLRGLLELVEKAVDSRLVELGKPSAATPPLLEARTP